MLKKEHPSSKLHTQTNFLTRRFTVKKQGPKME